MRQKLDLRRYTNGELVRESLRTDSGDVAEMLLTELLSRRPKPSAAQPVAVTAAKPVAIQAAKVTGNTASITTAAAIPRDWSGALVYIDDASGAQKFTARIGRLGDVRGREVTVNINPAHPDAHALLYTLTNDATELALLPGRAAAGRVAVAIVLNDHPQPPAAVDPKSIRFDDEPDTGYARRLARKLFG
jgi:hypothetical protein